MGREVIFAGDPISKQVQTRYKDILSDLATKWDTDIIMCLCHGKYDLVPQEMSFDKLYIFVQLLPKEFEGIKKHEIAGYKINGKELVFPVKEDSPQKCPQGDTLSFTGSPTRAEIVRDDNDVAIAVIHDGAIYILNDFIHCRSTEELNVSIELFNFIVETVITKSNVLNHLKSGVEEKSKRALEAALRIQFTQRLDKEVLQLKAAKDTITQYEKGITEAVRKVTATEKIVMAIKLNIEDVPTALNKTWLSLQKMRNSSSYSGVSFTKSGIKAITTPINIKHQGKEYVMGRFEVSLQFDGVCKIVNLDHRIDNYDHPHINGGQVCWGNFAGYIPKLIGSSEFDVALVQIYTFLSHYDSGSPYKTIDHWPLFVVAEKEKA